jgi:hypothetical protein
LYGQPEPRWQALNNVVTATMATTAKRRFLMSDLFILKNALKMFLEIYDNNIENLMQK